MKPAKIDLYPELKEPLAEMLADGVKQDDICEAMGVSDPGTVREWAKRPDIQQMVTRVITTRSNRIIGRVTKRIEAKLSNEEKDIGLKDLTNIYEKFSGSKIQVSSGDPAQALAEVFEQIHSDPEMAAALAKLAGPKDPATDPDGD